MSLFGGQRPDLTPAQLLSAVPVLASLAAGAGLWRPDEEQAEALRYGVLWGSALVVADALLRTGRGIAARPSGPEAAAMDVLTHPDAEASPWLGPPVEIGDEPVVLDPVTEWIGDDDLEPVPADDDEVALAELADIDPDATKTGEADLEASKPAEFR